jgi:hypothetical protein
MKLLVINEPLRPTWVDTPPIAHPVVWSNDPRNACSTGVRLQTAARTVLVLPGSSTSRRGRAGSSAGRGAGEDDQGRQPHAHPRPDGHGRGRGRDDGVGDVVGGCYPLAPATCPPSLSSFFTSTVRKGNKKGGRS